MAGGNLTQFVNDPADVRETLQTQELEVDIPAPRSRKQPYSESAPHNCHLLKARDSFLSTMRDLERPVAVRETECTRLPICRRLRASSRILFASGSALDPACPGRAGPILGIANSAS